jgi:hypothetical protein
MRLSLLFAVIFVAGAVAGEKQEDGFIPIAKFEMSAPAPGRYAPWRGPDGQLKWYAGELINITNSSFRYTRFSDVARPQPDFAGSLKIHSDHIYLDHPGIPYPYRVAGKADGIAVLMTWEGFEEWKKGRRVFMSNILYHDERKANKAVQRTGASRSAQESNRTSSAAGSRR